MSLPQKKTVTRHCSQSAGGGATTARLPFSVEKVSVQKGLVMSAIAESWRYATADPLTRLLACSILYFVCLATVACGVSMVCALRQAAHEWRLRSGENRPWN